MSDEPHGVKAGDLAALRPVADGAGRLLGLLDEADRLVGALTRHALLEAL